MTKAKITDLPGMVGKGVAPISIPEVDKLVDGYVRARDVRMAHTKTEVEAKTKLIDALRGYADKIGSDKDGTITYRHDDLIVVLRHGKDDLKVRSETPEGDDNGED